MRRALVWLNLYGREAVRHKLKNGLKTQKRHFLAVLDLMSDCLTNIYVKQHQCPSHQPILLTQGPIPEIFMNNFWKLEVLKIIFFASFPWKSFNIDRIARMVKHIDDFSGLQHIPGNGYIFATECIWTVLSGSGAWKETLCNGIFSEKVTVTFLLSTTFVASTLLNIKNWRQKLFRYRYALCIIGAWIGLKFLGVDSIILGARKFWRMFPIKQKFNITATFFLL